MAGTTASPQEQTLEQWRTSMFEEMGFDNEAAQTLSEARDNEGWLIATHDVEELINNGCPVDLAMRILL